MPDTTIKEKIATVVDRHTNEVTGYEEVTEKMRENIVSLAELYEVYDKYPLEKMAKMYAEPIYYLRKSLENQMGISPDDLVGLNEREIKEAQEKRDRVRKKLMNQVTRQFRFWTTFLNNIQ